MEITAAKTLIQPGSAARNCVCLPQPIGLVAVLIAIVPARTSVTVWQLSNMG
jgi:hypothetical protein